MENNADILVLSSVSYFNGIGNGGGGRGGKETIF